jgi:hypothetical protein
MLWWTGPLRADSHPDGIPDRDEVETFLAEDEKALPETTRPFSDAGIRFGILAEFIVYYIDISDESDANSDGLWDFFLSSLELDLDVSFNPWLKAEIVMAGEDIGKKDETESFSVTEAFVTIGHPDFPVYFIGGKRTQPFGVFEDRMISGTLTEDLYEIDGTGATFGVTADQYHLDLSFTVYEGQDIIANLEDVGTHEFSDGRQREDGIESYIANLTVSPMDDRLDLSLFYSSEPGNGSRNDSIGSAISVSLWDFVVDAEYITAIKRELGGNGAENLESAWFVALAFQPAASLELATRMELFDDDQDGEQADVITRRYLAGMNYGLTDYLTLSLEYRHSEYEREGGSEAADHQNEIQFQFAIAY